jgi:hypothetical protein
MPVTPWKAPYGIRRRAVSCLRQAETPQKRLGNRRNTPPPYPWTLRLRAIAASVLGCHMLVVRQGVNRLRCMSLDQAGGALLAMT